MLYDDDTNVRLAHNYLMQAGYAKTDIVNGFL